MIIVLLVVCDVSMPQADLWIPRLLDSSLSSVVRSSKSVVPATRRSHRQKDRVKQRSMPPIGQLSEWRTPVHLSTVDYFLEVVRSTLRARLDDRSFLRQLFRRTGLRKQEFHRFLCREENHHVSVQTIVSLLDVLQLRIVIRPQ